MISIAFLLIIIVGILWLVMVRPEARKLMEETGLKDTVPKAAAHCDLDRPYSDYRQALGRWFQTAIPSAVLSLFFIIGLAIFLLKISQTSNSALQYSNQAQTELGSWAIGIFLLAIAVNIPLWPSLFAAKSFKKAKEELSKSLRDALAFTEKESETREKIEIEDMLRKLVNAKGNIFSELNNKL